MTVPFTDLDRKYGLPEGFLASVWQQESGCGRDTYNEKSGCRGHFQFKPATRDEVLRESGHDAFSSDPREAAQASGYYYAKLHRQFGGDIRKTLAAYNWGMGNLSRKGLENAPRETRNYITEILARIDVAEEEDFTNRYVAGEVTDPEELERARRRRVNTARAAGMSDEQIAGMKDGDIFGTMFVVMLAMLVGGMAEKESPGITASSPAGMDAGIAAAVQGSLALPTPVTISAPSAPLPTPAMARASVAQPALG